MDRHTTATRHQADTNFQGLVTAWSLSDVLQYEMEEAAQERDHDEFHARFHNYYYTDGKGKTASSRLDRWYHDNNATEWIRGYQRKIPGVPSDHDGMVIHISPPNRRANAKQRPAIYPPIKCAQAAIYAHSDGAIKQFARDIATGANSGHRWDRFKAKLVRDITALQRQCKLNNNRTFKSKLAQLTQQLTEARHKALPSGDSTFRDLRNQIIATQCEWGQMRNRKLMDDHTQQPGQTTKKFFRRFSNKYDVSTIYASNVSTINSAKPREIADALAAAWRPIMTGTNASAYQAQECFFTALPTPENKPYLAQIDEPISLTEVSKAIKACKLGKSAGPDRLNNDWYRQHVEELAPLLTFLFKASTSSSSSASSPHASCTSLP